MEQTDAGKSPDKVAVDMRLPVMKEIGARGVGIDAWLLIRVVPRYAGMDLRERE